MTEEGKNSMEQPEEFFKLEDGIARDMTHADLEQLFLKESAKVRAALEGIISGSTEPLSRDLFVNIAKMRRYSRLAQFATAQMKLQVAARLQKTEDQCIQLHNITNETQHIQKEIARCLQYSAGDEDIDMIPEEEFYATAPESISNPEVTKTDEHAKHLSRLNWELEQRKNLVCNLNEQEGRKSVLISDINGKAHRLKSLKPKIDNLIKAAKPVQDLLGVRTSSATSSAEQRSLFSLLPSNLSVLYVQAEAYKDIMNDDDFQLRICGSADHARKWSTTHVDEEGGSDNETEETEESQRATKRLELSKNKVLEPFPIHIVLEIGCSDDVTAELKVQSVPELRISTISYSIRGKLPNYENLCKTDVLFDDLYADDDGIECPDLVGEAKLKHMKLSVNDFPPELGKPYKFVQALTGSQSVKNGDDGVQLADALQELVDAVRNRIKNRLGLVRSLRNLESRTFNFPRIPRKLLTELNGFKRITEEEFLSSVPSSLAQNESFSAGFHFLAEFQHSKSQLSTLASIFIPNTYPDAIPHFEISFSTMDSTTRVSAADNEKVKALQTFINTGCDNPTDIDKYSLVSFQLAVLAAGADILNEIDSTIGKGSEKLNNKHHEDEPELSFDFEKGSFCYI